MKIVLYESKEALRESERWIAWLTQEQFTIDKFGKRTGSTKTVFLPVYFFGPEAEIAERVALAFWHDEKAKKQSKRDRAKQLGLSRAATRVVVD